MKIVDEKIATLRLDISDEWKSELLDSLMSLQNNVEIRVLILHLTGEGCEKTADVNELANVLKKLELPIILVVEGFINAELFEIVLASHICFATESAGFEIVDKSRFEKEVGSKYIENLNLVGDEIDAETALELGIINRIVVSKNIYNEAFEMALNVSKLAPLAIRSCIKAVNEGLEMSLEDGLKLETKLFSKIFATEDMKEGTSAFLEKRKPTFYGK